MTIGSWPQASALLDNLSARYPGLAASIVANAVPQPTTTPSTGLPNHAECARRIRHALAAWVGALGPISKHLNVTDSQGRLLTVGAAANGGVAAGLRLRPNPGPDAMRIPPVDWTGTASDGSVWAGVRAGNVSGEYPAWPWQWALDWVVEDLEVLLKAKVLPLPGCKPYNDERRWQLAKCLTGKHRSLAHNPIDGQTCGVSPQKCLPSWTSAAFRYTTWAWVHRPSSLAGTNSPSSSVTWIRATS